MVGRFAQGVDAELDELRGAFVDRAADALRRLKSGSAQRTGIGSLKVRFNSVFGYYIESYKGECEGRAGGLRAEADAGERRALYDAGAEGAGDEDSDRAGAVVARLSAGFSLELRRQLLVAATRVRESRAARRGD